MPKCMANASFYRLKFRTIDLSGGCSLHFIITRLMLATADYYIWRERNARVHSDAPHTSSMIYRDISCCIVSKVNLICNMASSVANRRLHHILLGDFLMIFSVLIDLNVGF